MVAIDDVTVTFSDARIYDLFSNDEVSKLSSLRCGSLFILYFLYSIFALHVFGTSKDRTNVTISSYYHITAWNSPFI